MCNVFAFPDRLSLGPVVIWSKCGVASFWANSAVASAVCVTLVVVVQMSHVAKATIQSNDPDSLRLDVLGGACGLQTAAVVVFVCPNLMCTFCAVSALFEPEQMENLRKSVLNYCKALGGEAPRASCRVLSSQ